MEKKKIKFVVVLFHLRLNLAIQFLAIFFSISPFISHRIFCWAFLVLPMNFVICVSIFFFFLLLCPFFYTIPNQCNPNWKQRRHQRDFYLDYVRCFFCFAVVWKIEVTAWIRTFVYIFEKIRHIVTYFDDFSHFSLVLFIISTFPWHR